MSRDATPAAGAGRGFRRAALRVLPYAFAFLASLALIIVLTWPWCQHWQGEFLKHWDPPFHAWKLEFMARRILAGDVFIRSGDTNMLYPHSGALYFEALQWPPAVLGALLLGAFKMPPELVYHVTLVVFWALRAPCMLFLLRQLGCRNAAAVAGSVIFCILPHGMTYMVEYQMELIYAIPLFYAFLIRFFRGFRPLDGVLLALSWWLLAVSELYEAVFVLFTVPFILIAFLSARPKTFLDRRFYISGACAAGAGVLTLPLMLLPYLTQQGSGTVQRPLKEVLYHSAQPFGYLLPWGRHQPWTLKAVPDEFSLYPTVAVLVLAVAALVIWLVSRAKTPAGDYLPTDVAPRFLPKTRAFVSRWLPEFVVFIGFAFVAELAVLQIREGGSHSSASLVHAYLRTLSIAIFPFVFFHPKGESSRTTFLRGLAAGAVLCTIFSWGPNVCLGYTPGKPGLHPFFFTENKPYLAAYNHILPFLGNFRVVSRFGVFTLFFLVCAAACSLDCILRRGERRLGKAGGFVAAVAAVAVVALCVVEAVPKPAWTTKYRGVDPIRESPAVARLVENHPIRTLAGLPIGHGHSGRDMEGMRMFSMLKGDFPYVYVWGGYFPEYAQDISNSIHKRLWNRLHGHLASMYPPCLVFRDRDFEFDDSPLVLKDGTTEELSYLVPVDEDARFTFYDVAPLPPAEEVLRRFRTDVARLNPVLDAEASTAPGATVRMRLNGELFAEAKAGDDGRAVFKCDFSGCTRSQWKLEGNELSFTAEASGSAELLSVTSFTLLGADGVYHDPCKPYTEGESRFGPVDPYRPNKNTP